MAVDLSIMVESLKRAVSTPGSDNYEGVSESTWVGYLTDAFWNARLNGLLTKYKLDGTSVVPRTEGKPDIDHDELQLVVMYAGFNFVLAAFQNVNSSYRAKSGPVEYEVQRSAQVLKGILDILKARLDGILTTLRNGDDGTGTSVAVFDAVITAQYSQTSSIGG